MEFDRTFLIEPEQDLNTYFKSHYFVDVENAGNRWINLISDKKISNIYLFFTLPSPHISYLDLSHILNSTSNISCVQCEHGPNAVDFVLISYLGYLLASATAFDQYFIISNDRGFDAACAFWNNKGYKVVRLEIGNEPNSTIPSNKSKKLKKSKNQKQPPSSKPANVNVAIRQHNINRIRNVLPGTDKDAAEEIFELLEEKKEENLQMIYRAYVKKYGQEVGLRIYKHIKPLINDILSMLI